MLVAGERGYYGYSLEVFSVVGSGDVLEGAPPRGAFGCMAVAFREEVGPMFAYVVG